MILTQGHEQHIFIRLRSSHNSCACSEPHSDEDVAIKELDIYVHTLNITVA